jgi:hypothetical protein
MILIENIKDRINIYKNKKTIRKIESEYYKDIKKIEQRKGDAKEISKIMTEISSETHWYRDNINFYESQILIRTAKKLTIPLPKYNKSNINDEFWETIGDTGGILKDKGKYILTKMIRAEKKEIRDAWMSHVTIIIGLIGTLIGLISVWKD